MVFDSDTVDLISASIINRKNADLLRQRIVRWVVTARIVRWLIIYTLVFLTESFVKKQIHKYRNIFTFILGGAYMGNTVIGRVLATEKSPNYYR